MKRDRWSRVQELFSAALEQSAGSRAAFLRDACQGDEPLASEVWALLVAHHNSGPLDRLAEEIIEPLTAGTDTNGMAGRTIAQYAIVEKVSGGGMGVVYRAHDTRLDRWVALKFILPHLRPDTSAERRFMLEARAAAALEHPNVCTIHEIGQTGDGQLYIVMPLYDGESLRHRMRRGLLSVDEVLDLGVQVCRGLSKAHEHGIVHRDIKPANVLVTADGIVKILDFGVAKLVTESNTATGDVIGTVAYMSPEQANGERVDHRSDVWSVGVLLYEMLAGEPPFAGPTVPAVLNAVLTEDPVPLTARRPDIPPDLDAVISHALAKEACHRPATILELAAGLEAIDTSGTSGETSKVPPPARLLPEGERRQATILVTQIAGYDALVEQLPAVEVDDVIERIHRALDQIVSEHGGVVNQFGADAIVSLFGVPTTHEDDAVRAGRAALSLHAAVEEMVREGRCPRAVSVQSGIDSGHVIAQSHPTGDQRYRVVGDPVLVASRIAGEAGAGEVLVSGENLRLLGSAFESEDRDPIRLKGGSSTTPGRLLQYSGHLDRIQALPPTYLTAYTGREAELATLQSRLQLALGGQGQFVSVVGDAGLGKSRLLQEFGRTLEGADVSVLRGRCQSYGNATAYLPFLDMVRETLGITHEDPDADDIRTAQQQLAALASGLTDFLPLYLHLLSIPSLEFPLPALVQGEDLRTAIREALTAALTMRAAKRPVVAFFEDWHWVDDASADVLRHLVPMISSHPVLVVVAYRPDAPLEIGTHGHQTVIHLPPLGLSSVAAMVRSLLDVSAVPDQLAERICQRTAGNPFFIEEIVQGLRESGAVTIDDSRVVLNDDAGALELPDTVEGTIRSRLDRMDPHSREVLCYASVIGREFDHDILAALRPDDPQLDAALERLKGMGVIQPTSIRPHVEYRFKHALTQEVTYESLLQHQRRDLHGRVGAAMESTRAERMDDYLHRLAVHFAHAEKWQKAVEYGLRSAERAWDLSEFPESLRIVESVERWVEGASEDDALSRRKAQVLLRKERLCEVLGLRRRQLEIIGPLIEILEEADDRIQLAEAYLRLGDVQGLLHEYAAAEAAILKSLAIASEIGDGAHERKTLRSLGMLRWHQGRNEEAVSILEDVLAVDRESGDQDAITAGVTNLTTVLRDLGEYDRCRTILLEELAVHERRGRRERMPYLLHGLALTERALGNLDAALEYIDETYRIAESIPYGALAGGFHLMTKASLHWQMGATDEALETWAVALDRLRSSRHAEGLAQALRTLGDVLIGLNRPDEARPHFEEAVGLFAQLEDYEGAADLWKRIGHVHEQLGNYPEAMAAWGKGRIICQQLENAGLELDIVTAMARFTRSQVPEPSLSLQYYREAVTSAKAAGRIDREGEIRNTTAIIEWERGRYADALEEYERAYECFREAGESAKLGLILNSIGVTLHKLGRLDEAASRLRAAVKHNQETGAKHLEGLALAALGDLYRESGRLQEAIASYSQSLGIRRTLGDRRGEGWMLHHLARAHGALGALDRKRDCATASWRIAEARKDDELIDALRRL